MTDQSVREEAASTGSSPAGARAEGATRNGPPRPPLPLPEVLASWREELGALGGPAARGGASGGDDGSLDLVTAHPSGIASFLAGRPTRLSHLFREPGALDDARRRARAIRLAATALADEHGLRACVLAVGQASWRGRDGVVVSTPVLLRPLDLRPRGSGAVDYELGLELPVRTNPALVRELRGRGIALDGGELAQLAVRHHGFDPTPSLEHLRALTRTAAPDIEVRPGLLVTALVDVAPALIAELERLGPDLGGSDVALALAGDAGAARRLAARASAPGAEGEGADDGARAALDAVRVLPLDASQRRALETVLAGRSLLLEAGPGTGGTQVAAAAVAALVATGRRVLLVPGQQVEVEDVAARLAPLGLAHLVLAPDTSDPASTGPQQAQPPAPPPGTGSAAPGPAGSGGADSAGRRITRSAAALHAPHRPWGVSALDCLQALTRLDGLDPAPRTAVRLPAAPLAAMDPRTRDQLGAQLHEAVELGALSVTTGDTPWSGADLTDPEAAAAALTTVAVLRARVLPDLRSQMRVIARTTGLREPATVREAAEELRLLTQVRSTLDLFTTQVFERPVTDLADATASAAERAAKGVRAGLLARRRAERAAHELLRPGVVAPDLHEALVQADASRRAWLSWQVPEMAGAPPLVPQGLPVAEAECASATELLVTLQPALATTAAGGDLVDADWTVLEERLAQLEQDAGALEALPRRTSLTLDLHGAGLGQLLDDLRERAVAPDLVVAELERAWWTSVLSTLREDDADLAVLDPAARAAGVADLVAEEEHRAADAAARADRSARRARAQGGVSVRVSSPLALPHDVPQDEEHDVVVCLGAHRTGVPEAVLALASARQVLVIGDPGGLPPAPFAAAADDGSALSRPSVFTALAGVLPSQRLEEQHRMPEELAGLAQLVPGAVTGARSVPGSPVGEPVRLSLVPDGSGRPDEHGSVESPDAEVARVVDLIAQHARQHPDLSLAVVALTRPHARRIADAVRLAYSQREELAGFLARRAGSLEESFVVTDVERAGDTVRDAVILSIGFGPTPLGRFAHRFGPLDAPDGQRRLAVALTRARSLLTVVTSVGSGHLEEARITSTGGRALHAVIVELERLTALGADRARGAGDDPAVGPAPSDPLMARFTAELHRLHAETRPPDVTGSLAVGVPLGGVVDLAVVAGPATATAAHGRGGRAPVAVAVLTDLAAPRGGRDSRDARDPAGAADDPAAVVQAEVALPDELRRHGWRVVRVGAAEVFADPTSAARRVLAEVHRP